MEIREVTDQETWDNFIITHAPQSLFQSWLWGNVVALRHQYAGKSRIWRLGLFTNDKLIGVAQVQKVSAKKGTFLHLRHGPILQKWDQDTFRFIIEYLKKLAKQEHAIFIRISPLIENNTSNQSLLKSFGFIPSPLHALDSEYCWILDLVKSEEELFAGMRKTTRYLVRQAQKLNVTVTQSGTIDAFLKLYQETATRQGFVPHQQIKEEWQIFGSGNNALLLQATHEGKLLAAAVILFYGNEAIYHHAASLKSKIPAAYLLQWEAIRQAKRRGMRYYNFWGIAPSDKPRHPWQGITLFKQGFGGEVRQYLHAHDLPLHPLYGLTYIAETIRRIRRGY